MEQTFDIQQVKKNTDIVAVVNRYVQLKRKGSRWVGHCPFHEDRTPSFYVTPALQIFKCYGCDQGGDVFTFIQKIENTSFTEAKSRLGENSNILPAIIQQPIEPEKEPDYISPELVEKSLANYDKNNLVKWLCAKLGQEVVMPAIEQYQVGTGKGGATIFFQIDRQGKCRSGNAIVYRLDSHKRNRDISPRYIHRHGHNYVRCFFGEHLLRAYPDRPLAIVESEKTAVVCSIYLSRLNYVWLASSGKENLKNPKVWEPLRGRKIILYPDLGELDKQGLTPFSYWLQLSANMAAIGYDVTVNDFMEQQADDHERAEKLDLADILLDRPLNEFEVSALPEGYYYQEFAGRMIIMTPDNYPVLWDE